MLETEKEEVESKLFSSKVEYINLCDRIELTNLCKTCIISSMSEKMRSMNEKIKKNNDQCKYDDRRISVNKSIEDDDTQNEVLEYWRKALSDYVKEYHSKLEKNTAENGKYVKRMGWYMRL